MRLPQAKSVNGQSRRDHLTLQPDQISPANSLLFYTVHFCFKRPSMPKYSHGFFEDAPNKSVGGLEKWCDGHGLRLSRGVHVRDGRGGWGVFATRDFELGQICESRVILSQVLTPVCQVPKESLLSVRTASLPRLLPDSNLGVGSSHTILYLALCLLHELRLGEGSEFWGYLQSLPRETILLPVFWTIEDLSGDDGRLARELIVGTEAERDIFRKDSEGLGIVRNPLWRPIRLTR